MRKSEIIFAIVSALIFDTAYAARSAESTSPDFIVPVVGAAPSNAKRGQIVYRNDLNQLQFLSSNGWSVIGSSQNTSNPHGYSAGILNTDYTRNAVNKPNIREFATGSVSPFSNSDATYTTSANNSGNGDFITINTAGLYSVTYYDSMGANGEIGVSVGASSGDLSTAVDALSPNVRLSYTRQTGRADTSVVAYFQAGAVVRPHTNGQGSTGSYHATFCVTRLGQ